MQESVYMETSVISYHTAKASRDVVTMARQAITQEWWESARKNFQVYVSALVVQEAIAGDAEAADKRLALIQDLPVLEINTEAEKLAAHLMRKKLLPENSAEDALHIALATVHGMEYILTWNFKHINNATMKTKIRIEIESLGYECPVFCSPEEIN